MNPANPEEVFTCNDLVEGKPSPEVFKNTDYKICRKERRFQTQKSANLRRCFDYRSMGKLDCHSQKLLSNSFQVLHDG